QAPGVSPPAWSQTGCVPQTHEVPSRNPHLIRAAAGKRRCPERPVRISCKNGDGTAYLLCSNGHDDETTISKTGNERRGRDVPGLAAAAAPGLGQHSAGAIELLGQRRARPLDEAFLQPPSGEPPDAPTAGRDSAQSG